MKTKIILIILTIVIGAGGLFIANTDKKPVVAKGKSNFFNDDAKNIKTGDGISF